MTGSVIMRSFYTLRAVKIHYIPRVEFKTGRASYAKILKAMQVTLLISGHELFEKLFRFPNSVYFTHAAAFKLNAEIPSDT